MTGKTIGWVIILVALAVPAFLFWNWLGKMKAQSQSIESPRKTSESAAFGMGSVRSSTGPAASAAPAAAVSASTSSPAGPQTPPTAGLKAPGQAAEPPKTAKPAPSAPTQSSQSPGPGTGALPGQADAQAPAARRPKEASIEYNPVVQRDPTISPTDIKRKLMEEERLQANRMEQQQEIAGIKKAREQKKAEPPCEERIQLYGIISMPSGNAAMVNDGTAHEGDTVQGAIVKKITTNTVVFNCRGRTFIKKVSK